MAEQENIFENINIKDYENLGKTFLDEKEVLAKI